MANLFYKCGMPARPPLPDKEAFRALLAKRESNQAELARFLGLSDAAVSNILKGKRQVTVPEAGQIAIFLDCQIIDVLVALGVGATQPEMVRIMGHVGAEDQIILYDDGDQLTEFVNSPVRGYQGIVVKVKGGSAHPRYKDGEFIAFKPNSGDIGALMGEEVIARLTDGRLLLKILERGTEPDKYVLAPISSDARTIVNVGIEWVAQIDFHLPRRS